ncbi:aspartic peptidase domain-containing protein [Aspergillus desertorum]
MRLSQCLLSAAYLYTSANAFIPYSFKIGLRTGASDSPERRFVPVKLLSGDISSGTQHDEAEDQDLDDSLLSLDIKTHIRRDNIYKVVLADKPASPNTVALHQDGLDFSYFSTVNVGTPGQPVWMMLDTGGANTWVFGADCTSSPCQMHNTFGDNSSSTVKTTSDTFMVGYGSGKVSGNLVTDRLKIADIDVQMTFGLATNATDDFRNYPIDGILGLGRSNDTSMGGRRAFMDLVAQEGDLDSNIVAFHMSRNSDGERDGTVTFGGVDKTKFKGDVSYTKVAESSIHWSIPLDDASVNGKACGFIGKTAIIDTGTSYSLFPPNDAQTIHALIPGSKRLSDENYLVPCDSTAKVQFTFSGVSYTMSPKDYIGASLESGDGCVSTIIAQAVFGDDVMILGDTFLKNVYSVFDFDNDRIGFAQLPGSDSTATNTTTATVASPTDTFATESDSGSTDTSTSASSSSSSSTTDPTGTSAEFTGTGTTAKLPAAVWRAATLLFLVYIY